MVFSCGRVVVLIRSLKLSNIVMRRGEDTISLFCCLLQFLLSLFCCLPTHLPLEAFEVLKSVFLEMLCFDVLDLAVYFRF